MAKPADRKTQRQLEDLRKELLDDANTLHHKRSSMNTLDTRITSVREFRAMSDEQRDETYGRRTYYNYTRQHVENVTDEQLTSMETTMAELRPQIRDLSASLNARAEPAWKHIACHDDPTWAKVAEDRPKILRAEGTPVLCRLAAIVSKPARVPLGMWVIRTLRQRKKDGQLYNGWIEKPVPGLNASAFSAIHKYLEEKPDLQLKEQLDRIGLEQLAAQAREYRASTAMREALAGAGQKMADIDAGELRLMQADDLKHVGKWLQCCIGSESYGYPTHARNKTKAFLCVFPQGEELPVCAIEITPVKGQLHLGQVQGRMNRYWEHRDQVQVWVDRKETRQELAAALEIEGIDEEVCVTVSRQCDNRSAWTNVTSPWGGAPTWDVSQAAIGILTNQASEVYAYDYARQYASPEVAAELKQLVASARERSTNSEMRAYSQLESRIEEQAAEVEAARELYNEMDQALRDLRQQRADGPPALPAEEVEQLLGVAPVAA